MPAKVTNYGERLLLASALVAIGAMRVRLAKAPFTLNDNALPTDFTEANYPGYAAMPLVFQSLENGNPGGKAVGDFQTVTFRCTGNNVPNVIYGYWIEDAPGNVMAEELFTGTPRPMAVNGDTLSLAVRLRCWSPL